MQNLIKILKYNITKFNKYFEINMNSLHRWCHIGMPNCNEDVIERKIKFALLDNDQCYKTKEKLIKTDK